MAVEKKQEDEMSFAKEVFVPLLYLGVGMPRYVSAGRVNKYRLSEFPIVASCSQLLLLEAKCVAEKKLSEFKSAQPVRKRRSGGTNCNCHT